LYLLVPPVCKKKIFSLFYFDSTFSQLELKKKSFPDRIKGRNWKFFLVFTSTCLLSLFFYLV